MDSIAAAMFSNRTKKLPPPLLFKYFGDGITGFLRDPQIWLSNPAKFNDPFDMAPSLKIMNKERAVEELDFRGIHQNISIKQAENLFSTRIKEGIPKHWRIYCLTEKPEDLLMWSHYANHHKGCVIGFNSELVSAIQRGSDQLAGIVDYSESRPTVEFPESEYVDEENLKAIFTKAKAWEYENEWRIALRYDDERDPEEIHHKVDFPHHLVHCVIFGAKSKESGMYTKCVEALKNSKLKGIKRYFARLSQSNFKVETQDGSGREVDWKSEGIRISEANFKKRDRPNSWWYRPTR